jgi:hypothetical protein
MTLIVNPDVSPRYERHRGVAATPRRAWNVHRWPRDGAQPGQAICTATLPEAVAV